MEEIDKVLQPSRLSVEAAPGRAAWLRLRRGLLAVVDGFNAALLLSLSLVLGVLTCIGIAQVLSRYLFDHPLVWSEEAIRYGLIWSVFLGGGIAVRRGLLASVELVSQFAPTPLRRLLAVLSLGVCGLFWLTLLVYGVLILESVRGMTSGSLEMPMPMVYLAIPVGAAIALVNTFAVALDPAEPPPDMHFD